MTYTGLCIGGPLKGRTLSSERSYYDCKIVSNDPDPVFRDFTYAHYIVARTHFWVDAGVAPVAAYIMHELTRTYQGEERQ